MSVSLVFLNWKRPDNLMKIIDTQSVYDCVSESIVFNNSPVPFAHEKAKVLNTNFDFGLKSRWAAASLATSKVIIFQDDDLILPAPTIGVLADVALNDPHRVHGVFGRHVNKSGYDRTTVYGPCDVVLTRAAAIHRTALPIIVDALTAFNEAGYALPYKNGEDIFMSYAVRSWHWIKPFAHKLPVVELPDHDALSHRASHYKERTEVCRLCKLFFTGRLPL